MRIVSLITLGLFSPVFLSAQSSLLEVYSIFQTSCMPCHSASQAEAGLDLEGSGATASLKALDVAAHLISTEPTTVSAKARGEHRIHPGRPDRSFLFKKVNSSLDAHLGLLPGDGQPMPAYGGPSITDAEREVIRQWILYGAKTSGTQFDKALVDDFYTNGGVQSFPDGPPDAPTAGEGFQVHMGPFYLPKGGEVEYFQKYALDLPEDLEVSRIEILMGDDSHHFIIYDFDSPATASAVPDGLRPNAYHAGIGLVAAVQFAQDLTLPAGTAFLWAKDLWLDLNSHYINYSALLPLQAEAYLNIYTQPKGTAKQEMHSTLIVNPSIPIPNTGLPVTHTQSITYPSTTAYLWGISGHTHKYGKAYKAYHRLANGQKGDLIYDGACPNGVPGCPSPWFDYQHIPFRYFEDFYPVKINPSNGLIHEATWVNDGPQSVQFGPTSDDEMMVMILMWVSDTTGLSTAVEPPPGVAGPDVTLAPNPASGQVSVSVPGQNGPLDVIVHDALGTQVYRGSPTGPTFDLDLTGITPGILVLEIRDPEGRWQVTRKLVRTP